MKRLVCPNKCNRRTSQLLECERVPIKKVRRININGDRVTKYIFGTTEDGFFNNWKCPICNSVCVKKKVKGE